MTTFVILHGAGGHGSDWDLVAAHLRRTGAEVLAPDLPSDQPVGLDAYADAVAEALAGVEGPFVVVAHSLAGFVAPLVCRRVPVEQLVLVAAMVPRPGETGGEWWEATGHRAAMNAQGLVDDSEQTVFLHDVDPEVLATTEPPRDQDGVLFEEVWPLDAWPDVATAFVLFRDDRFFPVDWLRALVEERLGIEPIEVPGGHCAYLSQPRAVADAILTVADREAV